MKKYKIIAASLLLIIVLVGGYLFIYKKHRDIANEEGSYNVSAKAIILEFQTNESAANTKYLDKTIIVSGKIFSIDFETQSMVLDEKLFAAFLEEIPITILPNSEVTIKGRLIGYDSLLEELKLDQCIIIN
ncbi:OB-fold protein [Flavobacterium gawalongense]|uniref:tRNA_anti-like n=1 Tax=Flavobacterium gawalongense TaxID=2594432 RepID=A0A553BA26_9FLAO|nr:hypothetical protein [Flavobacterium gawalongense]TRW97097.1 hypothetical protein FNW33_16780 [Flavobacterium gawalongense]TRX01817.1 hypothetical protein FNW12_16870 [Flavobacterium gawalongense]TRX05087.1 hypothetical protein FNW11_16640 [Flavobacterium gawalongense]TRX05972.1 hypothetical protein FNW10_16670 [Flavobacterium gawalongense]TRX21775.1 hypothetical protein FNW38_16650 [Flavobacterium gawalongense]